MALRRAEQRSSSGYAHGADRPGRADSWRLHRPGNHQFRHDVSNHREFDTSAAEPARAVQCARHADGYKCGELDQYEYGRIEMMAEMRG